MVADAGLERALGLAGIQLDERGSPIMDASTPVGTRPLEVDPTATPVTPEPPVTRGGEEDGERMTLAETLAALTGEAPETTVEAATATPEAPPTAPDGTPLSPREAELQRQLDELRAEQATATVQQQIDEIQGLYDQRWLEGEQYWQQTAPQQIHAYVVQNGLSETDEAWLRVDAAQRYGDWKATFIYNYENDPRLNEDSYNAPDVVSRLIAENGLSEDDRAAILQFAATPDVMTAFAESLGRRVAALGQRDAQVTQAARTSVNAHLRGALAPGAPAVSPTKLPYKFQGGSHNYEEAQAFSQLLRSGALRSRP